MRTVERISRDWVLATEIHKLEARLWRLAREEDLRVILFTSASHAEGKSTTVAYLATAMALHPERRVIAADLDFRDPHLNAHFKLQVTHGLGAAIRNECALQDAVIQSELPNLDLLLPLDDGEDPQLLLRTRECSLIIKQLRESYDLVLLDLPALLPVADASVVLPLADGVILIAMAGRTTKPAVRRAREICLGMNARILGFVLGNTSEITPGYGYGYGNGKYSHYYQRKKEAEEKRAGETAPPAQAREKTEEPAPEEARPARVIDEPVAVRHASASDGPAATDETSPIDETPRRDDRQAGPARFGPDFAPEETKRRSEAKARKKAEKERRKEEERERKRRGEAEIRQRKEAEAQRKKDLEEHLKREKEEAQRRKKEGKGGKKDANAGKKDGSIPQWTVKENQPAGSRDDE